MTGTSLFLYYGNSWAGSVSDGPSTFRFFDDFETWNATAGSTGWTDLASLPEPIADQTSAVVDGKIYSFGGYAEGPTDPVDDSYCYDPTNDSWTQKTPMPTPRWGMVGVEFDGKIYVFGGLTGIGTATGVAKNEVYDPVTDTWDTTKNAIPVGLADEGVMAVKVGTKIHLFLLSAHYEYDPATDTYTPKASMPTPRYWSTCALVNNKIYIIAGYGNWAVGVNEAYDIATDTWSTKARLPISIWGATRENPVINDKIYVVNGLDGANFYYTNYEYDPATNSWALKGSSSHYRDGIGCAILNNKMYLVGGRNAGYNPNGLTFHEVYDPSAEVMPVSDKWSFTGAGYVTAETAAKYKGNYGMQIQQLSPAPNEQLAQSLNS
ncbi:MAG: DUF2341 domain-containing protein [Bacteroidales bacterium]|nr:DUF2341 domain-containing protein [Bacteroidales bacterium]